MRTFFPFPVNDIERFKQDLLQSAHRFDHFCFLDSNNYPDYPYSTFGSFFAIDAIATLSVDKDCLSELESFREQHQDWLFGYISYDVKNEIEPGLISQHIDGIGNPLLHFFVPKFIVKIEKGKIEIGIHCTVEDEQEHVLTEFRKILDESASAVAFSSTIHLQHRMSRQEYITAVETIRQDIQRGDIYEMNFCQEFYAENAEIEPLSVFKKLNNLSMAPFSCYLKNKDKHLLCASPERFLKRVQHTLISQPIKGTRRRLQEEQQDKQLKQELFLDEKERSENVMIVDLVRNDFSKVAQQDSVKVEELFGIYTFEQVHQMISTITCKVYPDITFSDIITAVFPMGSMTGAPKMAAMRLIEKYERTKRGLYSGCVGYITPKGNFDLNVVIRSILYNQTDKYISIQAGSAITIDCDAEKEYEECLLKAKAMMEALK
ncbi:MAG: anthranilate synthase component I family protein [Chitinophagales bacterium]